MTNQLDNDPKAYGEVMSDINSDKWLKAMKFEMDLIGSNQVWTLVDPPKGVKPVGCKWVYKHKLGANSEVYNFIKNEHDLCVYKKVSVSSVAYLVLYVDDILLTGNDVKMLGDIKAWLSTQFFMKHMVEASYILGIKIYRDRSRRMAIAQAKEVRSHHRSKHILRRYHLLREMLSRGDVRMDRVSSAENTADPLTKPMSQIAHIQHLDKMGLRTMGDWL
ncbi:hypothetical protein Sango_1746800 [Sesamum angolense]|uniref:Reverse transcriptase Ty1/copia-type domain-containing protein n=1 Tax=Sesamum angolense TaxID=2727404 RepID=A0AAE1WM99_9LAMI|nr:hypothetical protein Sango_1746800 [Sesamum angolense]